MTECLLLGCDQTPLEEEDFCDKHRLEVEYPPRSEIHCPECSENSDFYEVLLELWRCRSCGELFDPTI